MMKLVENDSWLEPVADEVEARYQRYESKLKYIESQYGSLKSFASAHEFFGRCLFVDCLDLGAMNHAITYTQVGKVKSVLEYFDLSVYVLSSISLSYA